MNGCGYYRFDEEDINTCKNEAKEYIEFMESAGDSAAFVKVLLAYIEDLEKENKRFKEKNKKKHKKDLCVEKTVLRMIKNNEGSYERISKALYNCELDNATFNSICVIVSRLRKKGYDIRNIKNWGYEEVTND